MQYVSHSPQDPNTDNLEDKRLQQIVQDRILQGRNPQDCSKTSTGKQATQNTNLRSGPALLL